MKKREGTSLFIYVFFILIFFIWIALLFEPIIQSQPYNQTAIINVTVNITNSAPIITSISLETPITLIGYDTKMVYCNATAFDFDNNTVIANATFYYQGYSPDTPDDQNYHYTNVSCRQTGRYNTETNFTCGFNVSFFANNGTWYCNITVIDDFGAFSSNISNPGLIQPLIAIYVPGILDFGNLNQGENTSDKLVNITNAGNRNINISVEGWAQYPGDNLAMNCTFGNIPIQYERYNISANSDFINMYQLTSTTTMIRNFFIRQRTDENLDSVNTTYWKLYAPIGAGGVCTGKILFTATDRGI
ncbi:MAG: hypothetical protein QXE31_02200 [Candidatus Woesearchaeota archaeon]